jgi:hypothetical protein
MKTPYWIIIGSLLAGSLLACGKAPPAAAPAPTDPPAPDIDAAVTPVEVADATVADETPPPAAPVDAAPPPPPEEPVADTCAEVSSEMQDRLMPLWDACYQKAKKKNRLAGPAEVQIFVDDAGKIEKVVYQGSKDWGSKVSKCMVDATRKIEFDGTTCAGRMITARKEYRGEL